ncbi:MAG TPA: Rieske 2Fe-2S domain-containing protein [Chloroflexota bacterium]
MLTTEENERLSLVGRGTPGGDLLRRYWHPVCPAQDLTPEHPKKRVRLLGEDLVVFLPVDGSYGCVAEQCSHRGASLYYGFVEDAGIRCPYHGWMYDKSGACVEQPFEPAQSMMRYTIHHPAYPVEEHAGLLFLYLGPQPAPLFPAYDVIARRDGSRRLEIDPVLNCNWLQMMETNVDPTHNHYLHHYMSIYLNLGRRLELDPPMLEIQFEPCEWGIMKRSLLADKTGDRWEESGTAIFPNVLRHHLKSGNMSLHYRVPIDDTHSQTLWIGFDPSKDGSENQQTEIPLTYNQFKDENGDFTMSDNGNQDSMAWETQGPIRDRSIERLGATDQGVVLFRELLSEQIGIVRGGDDPLGVIRDPNRNQIIRFAEKRERVPSGGDPARGLVRQALSGLA